MKQKELITSAARFCGFFLVILHFLIPPQLFASNHLEISGYVGGTQFTTHDALLRVDAFEVDALIAKHNSFKPNLGIGAGYVFSLPFTNKRFLPYLKPMVNLRYFFKNNLQGKIFQYQDPEFYNYNYSISLESTRLMLDLALGVFSYNQFSGYLLGGFGGAWNQIGYHDQPLPGIFDGSVILNKNTTSKLVAEVGGGISYDLYRQLSFGVEYLYSNLGINQSSRTGSLNGLPTILSSIKAPLSSHSIQFVATWKFV